MSRTALALALATVATVVLTPTANADLVCPDDHICMWEHENYAGARYIYVKPPLHGTTYYEIDWWHGDNEISSLLNFTTCTISLFDNDLDASGSSWDISSKTRVPYLGRYGANDKAESFAARCP